MLRAVTEEERERRYATREQESEGGHGERRPWPLEMFGATRTFRVTCPSPRGEQRIGYAVVIPHRADDTHGSTMACLDTFGRHKSPGCREFPSRRIALAWLAVAAEDVEC